MIAASTQSIILLAVVPFVFWGILSVGFVVARRKKVKFGDARASGLLTTELPTGRPLSSTRGGVWLGGMAVSWPFVVLEIYPSDLVVRSPQGAFEPVALSRDAISRLRIDRSVFGVSLKVEGTDGREIDFSFRAFSRRSLRAALSNAGWLGLLAQ